jgi:hypothetical protein
MQIALQEWLEFLTLVMEDGVKTCGVFGRVESSNTVSLFDRIRLRALVTYPPDIRMTRIEYWTRAGSIVLKTMKIKIAQPSSKV